MHWFANVLFYCIFVITDDVGLDSIMHCYTGTKYNVAVSEVWFLLLFEPLLK